MENLFEINEVSNIISPKTIPPEKLKSGGTYNPLYHVWRKKNLIIFEWIQDAIAPTMFSLVINHEFMRVHYAPAGII